jgi:hypothetical protein
VPQTLVLHGVLYEGKQRKASQTLDRKTTDRLRCFTALSSLLPVADLRRFPRCLWLRAFHPLLTRSVVWRVVRETLWYGPPGLNAPLRPQVRAHHSLLCTVPQVRSAPPRAASVRPFRVSARVPPHNPSASASCPHTPWCGRRAPLRAASGPLALCTRPYNTTTWTITWTEWYSI